MDSCEFLGKEASGIDSKVSLTPSFSKMIRNCSFGSGSRLLCTFSFVHLISRPISG